VVDCEGFDARTRRVVKHMCLGLSGTQNKKTEDGLTVQSLGKAGR